MKREKTQNSKKTNLRLHLLYSHTRYAILLFIITFSIYCLFLSSSVFGGDSGDLLSAIAVRGVPHPSGYPLYTMIGIIFSLFPFPASLAWKVGLVSAILSSLAVVFVYFTILRLLKKPLYAFFASLSLAFLFPFWLYAQITEVASLQHFFIAAILYFAIVYRQTKYNKFLYIVAFLCGLSLTNNQTIILLFPAVFLLVIGKLYKTPRFLRNVLASFFMFVLGLLPYLYLPIAASFHPAINWNNPVTIQSFLQIVLRQDYGWLPTVVVDNSIKLLIVKEYFFYMFSELTTLGIMFIILGIVFWFRQGKDRLVPGSFLLGFFLFGPFFFYYGGGPTFDAFSEGTREKFYGSSLIFLIFFIPFGIEFIMSSLGGLLQRIHASKERIAVYQKVLVVFFVLLPFILFTKNMMILNLRDSVNITEVFAAELLGSLPKNSVVIALHDNIVFTSWHAQHVKRLRGDVLVTLPHELRNLAARGKLKLSQNDLTAFLQEDGDVNAKTHRIAMALPTATFISSNDPHNFVQNKKIILYPYGLVLRYATLSEQKMSKAEFLQKQKSLLAKLSHPNAHLPSDKKDRLGLVHNFPLFYSRAYSNTGFFLMYAYGDYNLARNYFQKAITIESEDDRAYEGLGIIFYHQKQYKNAQEAFEKAVAINPLNQNAYFLLYGTTLALKDTESARKLETFFKQYKTIYTDFKFGKTRVKLPE